MLSLFKIGCFFVGGKKVKPTKSDPLVTKLKCAFSLNNWFSFTCWCPLWGLLENILMHSTNITILQYYCKTQMC